MEKRMSYEEFTYRISEPITDEYGKSPIVPVFSLFEGKWKCHVIYALLCLGETRFNQVQEFCEPITPAALNTTLKDLISLGLIEKKEHKNERFPTYLLSEKGQDLMPCFYEMMNWGFFYRVSAKKPKNGK